PIGYRVIERRDVPNDASLVEVLDRTAGRVMRTAAYVGLAPVGEPCARVAALDLGRQRPVGREPELAVPSGALVVPDHAILEGEHRADRVERISMGLGPVARPPTSGGHGNLGERTQHDVDHMDVVVPDIPAPERIVIDPDEALQPAFEVSGERGVVEALAA